MGTSREQRLREKLKEEIGVSSWKGLIPETLTKSLFLVSKGLDLVEVGVQVALDNTGEVKKWIEGGLLVRPTKEQIAAWESYGSLFRFIIVAPFVFFQEYTASEN